MALEAASADAGNSKADDLRQEISDIPRFVPLGSDGTTLWTRIKFRLDWNFPARDCC